MTTTVFNEDEKSKLLWYHAY